MRKNMSIKTIVSQNEVKYLTLSWGERLKEKEEFYPCLWIKIQTNDKTWDFKYYFQKQFKIDLVETCLINILRKVSFIKNHFHLQIESFLDKYPIFSNEFFLKFLENRLIKSVAIHSPSDFFKQLQIFAENKFLTTLAWIPSTTLTIQESKKIFELIALNSSLETFELCNFQLTYVRFNITENLTRLNLCVKHFSGHQLSVPNRLCTLSLTGSIKLPIFFKLLPKLKELTNLTLSDNDMNDEDCCLLMSRLTSFPSSLKFLTLQNVLIKHSLKDIFFAMQEKKNAFPLQLQNLYLNKNKRLIIDAFDIYQMANIIKSPNCTLSSLRIYHRSQGISWDMLKPLLFALRNNSSLYEISCSLFDEVEGILTDEIRDKLISRFSNSKFFNKNLISFNSAPLIPYICKVPRSSSPFECLGINRITRVNWIRVVILIRMMREKEKDSSCVSTLGFIKKSIFEIMTFLDEDELTQKKSSKENFYKIFYIPAVNARSKLNKSDDKEKKIESENNSFF